MFVLRRPVLLLGFRSSIIENLGKPLKLKKTPSNLNREDNWKISSRWLLVLLSSFFNLFLSMQFPLFYINLYDEQNNFIIQEITYLNLTKKNTSLFLAFWKLSYHLICLLVIIYAASMGEYILVINNEEKLTWNHSHAHF